MQTLASQAGGPKTLHTLSMALRVHREGMQIGNGINVVARPRADCLHNGWAHNLHSFCVCSPNTENETNCMKLHKKRIGRSKPLPEGEYDATVLSVKKGIGKATNVNWSIPTLPRKRIETKENK